MSIYEMPVRTVAGAPVHAARTRAVLRFWSSDITLDLWDFPSDWPSLSDEQLATLARSACPPSFI